MGQIDCNLRFRWFAHLPMAAEIWHPAVFSHNRDRLLAADVAQEFLAALLGLAQVKALLSDDHFPVDGTRIDGWAIVRHWFENTGERRHEALSARGLPRT